ncbi:MAG TPA: hypothetical protein VGK74_22350 [Symbiobacteriaceae bacterium]|jgi:hypothetical protein
MGSHGRLNRKRAEGYLHRNETAAMERSQAKNLKELIGRGRVAAAVSSRTGGRCYMPDCREPIVSYPHAIPKADGGVHDPVNRCGLCGPHEAALHRGGRIGQEHRRYLQDWLKTWYAAQGLPPEQWLALAFGLAKLPGVPPAARVLAAH